MTGVLLSILRVVLAVLTHLTYAPAYRAWFLHLRYFPKYRQLDFFLKINLSPALLGEFSLIV